jgi:hypothetical protein
MKMSELNKLIREVVQDEFKKSAKKYIEMYVPIVMSETVRDLVDKRIQEVMKPARPSLKESLELDTHSEELEEWPTLNKKVMTTKSAPVFNRDKLAAMLGYDSAGGATNTISSVTTENGARIPIAPETIPPAVLGAMNKDYRSFMKKMDAHRPGSA